MYLIDLVKRMARKANIPILIYLVLNILIIVGISYAFVGDGQMPLWKAALIGIAAYAVSLFIAMSPFGEWIIRMQTGCKKIKRVEQIEFIEPIFREVYAKAKESDPSIPDDVRIYLNNDEEPNAFATGRKTICLTKGMLEMPEEQIKAVLGHEFGHLAHKDTDLILFVSVGNLIVTAFMMILKIIGDLVLLFIDGLSIGLGRPDAVGASLITRALTTVLYGAVSWAWTKIGVLLVMKSSRSTEFEADEFSYNLGYGNELCAMLDSLDDSHAKGLFASLASSHPDKDDRIAKLQEMGATYRAAYGYRA